MATSYIKYGNSQSAANAAQIAKNGVIYNRTIATDGNGAVPLNYSTSSSTYPYAVISVTPNVIVSQPFVGGNYNYYYCQARNLDGTLHANSSVTVTIMLRTKS